MSHSFKPGLFIFSTAFLTKQATYSSLGHLDTTAASSRRHKKNLKKICCMQHNGPRKCIKMEEITCSVVIFPFYFVADGFKCSQMRHQNHGWHCCWLLASFYIKRPNITTCSILLFRMYLFLVFYTQIFFFWYTYFVLMHLLP